VRHVRHDEVDRAREEDVVVDVVVAGRRRKGRRLALRGVEDLDPFTTSWLRPGWTFWTRRWRAVTGAKPGAGPTVPGFQASTPVRVCGSGAKRTMPGPDGKVDPEHGCFDANSAVLLRGMWTRTGEFARASPRSMSMNGLATLKEAPAATRARLPTRTQRSPRV
jgi:hypothetical protein